MQNKTANWQSKGRMRGVTLLELMIVVLVVGILAVIAYPSYQDQARKSKRADGKAMLMEVAQGLERCYTRFGRYNDAGCTVANNLPDPSLEGHYQISAFAISATAFTLDATPQGTQADDTDCGVLRLTSTGVQGSQAASTDANGCW